MADDAPEGWHVPQRRAMIFAAVAPLTLLAVVAGAGWLYRRDLAPHYAPVIPLPAPGIESFPHDGGNDPVRPAPQPKRDAPVEAAKRAIVAQGWQK
jgi:hypothetical protein